ncbi:MAG: DUF305 domain-containing protein [Cyanomargarita calcarea GSE-NOS-MK-12-04C]|jgi:uncharacterized protein (DUF305 family)|uniref:DUF305 domain-containing protein n=1 Tax=Cyanomargarita calcarea GSE-NOS-MK-12-04C TaxID=2839659 RepID=A0A951QTZ8_9CYAN|nr:DUF305 domain-containing protein [Cyanomargarita calcarea GSE-NOS-MK-12-04C]
MQLLSLKNGFLGLTFVAIASIGSLLTACSPASFSQNEVSSAAANTVSTTTTNTGEKQMNHSGMNHGGMNHNMDLGPADANYDLRFIDGMIPHHEGAVVMAKEALQKSKRPEIKKLANEIIKAQEKEIAELKQWRKAWYPKAQNEPQAWHAEMKHMMGMTPEQTRAMRMDMDLGAADGEFDLRFINAMIPHHEGAVVMAKDAASKSKRPEVKKLALSIISSQEAEINQMKQWRQGWYKK